MSTHAADDAGVAHTMTNGSSGTTLPCTIRNCSEPAERTFTIRIGRIKVAVALCAHHLEVAFAPDGRGHHPLPTTTVRISTGSGSPPD